MNTQMTVKSGAGRRRGGTLMIAVVAALSGGPAIATETAQDVGALLNPASQERGSARVMAMDATFVGVAEGVDALQWNPAGLGNLKTPEAGWNHLSGLEGTVGETMVVGVPAGPLGGLALLAEVVDNGTFESRDSVGNPTGELSAGSLGGGLGWGLALTKDLAVGAAVRGTRQTLGQGRYDSIAADAGVLWNAPVAGLTVGAALANLGASGSANDLAFGIRAGAWYRRELGARNQVLAALSTEVQPGGLNRVNLGVEDTLMAMLAVRVGYRVNLTDQQLDGLTGLTAGIGVTYARVALDYAYLPFGDLGNLQRISLTYRAAAKAPSSPGNEGGAQ